jgi:selenide,water dikinase
MRVPGKGKAADRCRAVAGRPLRRWLPQRDALMILSPGGNRAVAWRNGFVPSGRLVWRWKDHIDRKWMRRYAGFGR